MPTYDYHCADCGEFRERRPMAESSSPQLCPVCGVAAPRTISAPMLAGGAQPGWLMQAARTSGQQRERWRAACGLGCSHVH